MNKFALLATAPEGAGTMSYVLLFGQLAFLGVLFYFMLIRPQKKQQKQMAAMLSTVAIGDSVLTSSGFYGVVIDVMDDIVIVEFGSNKNCRIPMKKTAIVELEKPNMEKSE
ncbi:MAG: preprotein translocase subunit YajC [Clostridiales bacterium]|nr:preprotein translocase subunit YajC [Clostridiales bacterium]